MSGLHVCRAVQESRNETGQRGGTQGCSRRAISCALADSVGRRTQALIVASSELDGKVSYFGHPQAVNACHRHLEHCVVFVEFDRGCYTSARWAVGHASIRIFGAPRDHISCKHTISNFVLFVYFSPAFVARRTRVHSNRDAGRILCNANFSSLDS